MTLTINGEELELKYGFKAHKELQKIIKESGVDAVEFMTEEKYPVLIQVALKHVKEVSLEDIENAIEDLNYPQLNALVEPYLKYYSPNVVVPNP